MANDQPQLPIELRTEVLVLGAHPDDETLGCAGLLLRTKDPVVVCATNGVPRENRFWGGEFSSPDAYGEARRQELVHAIGLVPVTQWYILDSIPDQELHHHLNFAVEQLISISLRHHIRTIVTHTYEGGHPDHDSCSFVATEACEALGIAHWEFPLYRRGESGEMKVQQFCQEADEPYALVLDARELAVKRAMIEAHTSQAQTVGQLEFEREYYRRAPEYKYSEPPHEGQLNYEGWGFPATGREVSSAFAGFARGVKR